MEGWKLTKGDCLAQNISESEIWENFNFIFSTKSTNRTSYKYGFINSLVENIFNLDDNNLLDYEYLFDKFTNVYWNICVKFNLRQGDRGVSNKENKTSIEIIFDKYIENYNLAQQMSYDSIPEKIKSELVREITTKCKKYVIGAIYGDTNGNLFSFDLLKEELRLNSNVVEFIKKYKNIISRLNFYEWIKYLEKINSQKENILLTNLDYISKRSNLNHYRNILLNDFNIKTCFYCEKALSNDEKIEVDHFIPWTFVRDDKLWNLVISCRKCNNSKRDKIVADKYIEKIIAQNEDVLKRKDIDIVNSEYRSYCHSKIKNMYECAKFNGFEYGWEPK